MTRKDGRPLVTEFPVTAFDMIDVIPRGELVLPDDVIRCSLGEPYGFSSMDDEDPSPDDFDLWGA